MISRRSSAPGFSSVDDERIPLERLEVFEAQIPQVESFRSAIGERWARHVLYIRWLSPEGSWGIGECSCRPDPFYSAEFNSAVVELLRAQVLPRLEADGTVGNLRHLLQRVRGWPFAKSALLDAALDLLRRRGQKDFLDARPPRVRRVPAGISLGIFETADEAVSRVAAALEERYRRIKMKVRPEMGLAPLRAVRDRFPDAPLAFDANGSCRKSDIPAFLAALEDLSPLMVEQPFPASRLDWCVEAKERLPQLRVCLDESVEDLGDLEVAHRLGALDELNIKPGRVGGQVVALELLDRCREIGIPVWIGGMFETGVGRFANLRLAARVADAIAHDLSPSRRYFSQDVVAAPLDIEADGVIAFSGEQPVELDDVVLERFTTARWKLAKS